MTETVGTCIPAFIKKLYQLDNYGTAQWTLFCKLLEIIWYFSTKLPNKRAGLWIRIHFFADPDPAIFLNADPDPGGKMIADPCRSGSS